MEIQIIKYLSQYSVDCIIAAAADCVILYIVKKYAKRLPDKVNRVLPLLIALAFYLIGAVITGESFETVAKNAMTAGGLATVIYAFLGGLDVSDETELNDLLKRLLKNLVTEEKLSEVTREIMENLAKGGDDGLTVIKISDLIRANAADNADEQTVTLISRVFVEAFATLKSKKKNAIKE